MNENISKLKNAAVDYLDMSIKLASGGGRGKFRGSFTIFTGAGAIPVMIVGTADGSVEDGQAIAVLNPDPELSERIKPGVGYHGGLLKEILAGKCDGMVHVWLDAYLSTPDRAKLIDSYSPRTTVGAAKFEVD